MDTRAIAVAVLFGLIMGWGSGRQLEDLRPVVVALVGGIVTGAVIRMAGTGADAVMAGGSLLWGGAAGLVGLVPNLRRTSPTDSRSPTI